MNRTLISFAFASAVACFLLYPHHAGGALVLSSVTEGVYVGVCGRSEVSLKTTSWVTNGVPMEHDDPIALMAFCTQGPVQLVVPRKQYFIKFEMRDLHGQPVPKTALGQEWGSWAKELPALRELRAMMVWDVAGPHTLDNPGLSGGPSLPSPKELFDMERSGTYQLTIEVHLLKQTRSTNGWASKPITIPAFTVPVVKKEGTHLHTPQ